MLLTEEKSVFVDQIKKLQKDQDMLIQLQDEQSKSDKNLTKLEGQLEEVNEEFRQYKLDSMKESSILRDEIAALKSSTAEEKKKVHKKKCS